MATAPKNISDCLKELTVSSTEICESIIGREIGCGAYSRAFTVKYGVSLCAAKEIHSFLVEGVGQQLIRERFLQHCSVLKHPNIVHFVDINFNMNSTIMIIELMDRNLYDYIKLDIKNLPKYECFRNNRYILQDVVKGLVYLYEQKFTVFHGDLPTRNILLRIHNAGEAVVAKIGGLGVAKVIKADSKATQSMLTQVPCRINKFYASRVFWCQPCIWYSYRYILLWLYYAVCILTKMAYTISESKI